jgi:hypothetical protein
MKQEDFSLVVSPMFSRGCIALLNELYEWCVVDPSDMDEDKYTLAKKLAEVSPRSNASWCFAAN